MALGGNYGNTAGTQYSTFQAYIEIGVTETSATGQHLRYKYSIYVSRGDFHNSTFHPSWRDTLQVGGVGWWGDSGWIDAGWYNSGSTLNLSCNVWYRSSSRRYTSSCSASYTVPYFQSAPDAPTSVTLTRNSDTQLTLSWDFTAASNKPVTSQERALQINDDPWVYTTINDGTTKSATITAAANNSYGAAVRLSNSSGTSAWKYPGYYVYTSPATPSAATAIKTGTNVSLQATVSNIRYPRSYQWQRASKSDFSDATTLSGTAAVISDTTSLATPYYRVRCLGMSWTYSEWRTATLSKNPQLYVQIPDGKTIQDVYIRKD